jgi:putative Holliday junction resolvase
MRIMGIDYGDSRIGISISDPFGWTAQGIETINWKGNLKKPIQRIKDLIKEYKVKRIVVGFPKNMDGTVGPMAEKILEFIDVLANETKKEIVKWDERLTTVAAKRAMHETGVKTLKKKSVVDQIAAVYILQGYLDSIARQK